ncbi:hypothetical protein [Microbacterium murale]|uniref:Uncharacterized protein n=1 Tax=Microbacterium murale TaxID=1081040 RepID=A0ABU0PEA4_9MICO|nr:hypothetical protein [Microbacterium murale]MDQ0645661.1 hypothetical protein [Microbacterium murale]
MTAADLLAYISTEGLDPTSSEETFAGACWEQAAALISQHIGAATVPTIITERATLEVGAELFHRRDTKNGISQFMSTDGGQALRVARDPMVAAYPLLAPYVGRGIA